MVSFQVSIYPLDGNIAKRIDLFTGVLARHGLSFDVGSMSTVVRGTFAEVWPALQEAYGAVAARHPIVMTLTVSNACGTVTSGE